MPVDRSLTVRFRAEEVTLQRLASALGESDAGTPDEVFARIEDALEKVAAAALAEYRDHLSGTRPPTTISALREDRLMLLVEHLFGGDLPRDTEVEDLFQLTSGEARSLVRRVRARRRHDLEASIRRAARAALDAAEDNGATRSMSASRAVVEYLNGLLERRQTATALIKPDENANGFWIVTKSAYDALDVAVP
jgi:hypothetical protein